MKGLKEELLTCEVALKSLAEIGEFQRGKRFVKKEIQPAGVPCIHYGEMYTHYDAWATISN